MNQQNGSPTIPKRRLMSSSSSSGSSAGSSASSTAAATVGVASANTCRTKAYANGCTEQRSCRDCLAVATTGEGLSCYLDATAGTCNAFSELSASTLSLVESVTNTSEQARLLAANYVYAASSQKYCSANDGACSLCQAVADLPGYAPSSNQLKKMSSNRNICYGSNNCICVAKCEGDSWTESAGKRCGSSSTLPSYSTPSPASKNTQSKLLTYFGLVSLLGLVLFLMMFLRKKKMLRLRREANGPYNNPGVLHEENRLELPGWMAWQRELRRNEKHGDTAFVNLDKLRPSSSLITIGSEASMTTLPLSTPPSSVASAHRLSM